MKIYTSVILIALLLGSYNKINGQMSNNKVPVDLKINTTETKPKKLKFTTKNIHISTQCVIAGTVLTAASIISMATNNNGHDWDGPGIAKHVTPDRVALGIGLSMFSYGIIIRF
mgnify:FL=1